jgi:hypothetical protein
VAEEIGNLADYGWFLKKDMSAYNGKWVCIKDQQVLLADANLENVLNFVKKKGLKDQATITHISGAHVVL